jgi:hypothetical protein
MLGALLTTTACAATSFPGRTLTSSDNPLVTIGAGQAHGADDTWYVIDKRTQTCWMMLYAALAQLDCCALRRVSEAQPYITWTNCPGDNARPPAITPGSPAPAAAAPAASPEAH